MQTNKISSTLKKKNDENLEIYGLRKAWFILSALKLSNLMRVKNIEKQKKIFHGSNNQKDVFLNIKKKLKSIFHKTKKIVFF